MTLSRKIKLIKMLKDVNNFDQASHIFLIIVKLNIKSITKNKHTITN